MQIPPTTTRIANILITRGIETLIFGPLAAKLFWRGQYRDTLAVDATIIRYR